MAGARFLSQHVKILICLIGMLCMGYLIYPAITAGEFTDRLTIGRGLVFLAFTFFLVRNVAGVVSGAPEDKDDAKSEPTP